MVLDGGFCFSEAPWLGWGDIAYGLEHGFLSPVGVVEYAVEGLSAESPVEEYELACMTGDDASDVRECVGRLAASSAQDIEEAKKSWIFLIFLWVFNNKNKYRDPLGVAEKLHADFDYPESVAPVIRYMPAAGSSLEGEGQLFKNWSNMVESLRRELQANRSGRK